MTPRTPLCLAPGHSGTSLRAMDWRSIGLFYFCCIILTATLIYRKQGLFHLTVVIRSLFTLVRVVGLKPRSELQPGAGYR